MLNTKFKTTVCKYYEQSIILHFITHNLGTACPLGEKCHFAHGNNELRSIGDVFLTIKIVN